MSAHARGAERYWADRVEREQASCWWNPWLRAWADIGAHVALPRAWATVLELLLARARQLELERDARLAAAAAAGSFSTYPICKACGRRMESRDHRC